VPSKLAEDYRALVQTHIDTLSKKAAQQPVDYTLLNTSTPLDYAPLPGDMAANVQARLKTIDLTGAQ